MSHGSNSFCSKKRRGDRLPRTPGQDCFLGCVKMIHFFHISYDHNIYLSASWFYWVSVSANQSHPKWPFPLEGPPCPMLPYICLRYLVSSNPMYYVTKPGEVSGRPIYAAWVGVNYSLPLGARYKTAIKSVGLG